MWGLQKLSYIQVLCMYRVFFLSVPPNFRYQNEKRWAANQRFSLDGDDEDRSYYLVVRVSPPQPPSCHPLMPPSSDFSAYWWLARDVDGFYTPLPSNLQDSQFSHVNLRNLHLGIVYSSQIFSVWRFLKAFPRWWCQAIKVMWFMDSSGLRWKGNI